MTEIVKIDIETVQAIQMAQNEAEVRQQVIMNLLDGHAMDQDASFLESPIFLAYQKKAEEANLVFANLKTNLEKTYANPKNATSWNLDYASQELTLNF